MREANKTRQERHFQTFMRMLIVAFLGSGILLVVKPVTTLEYIERIGHSIFGWTNPPLQLIADPFWLTFVASFMLMLVYCAYKAQANHLRTIGYAHVILLAKFVTTLGFTLSFILVQESFVYLVSAIIDGLIFFITFVLFSSAAKSRPHY
jgi:hypothetical protein